MDVSDAGQERAFYVDFIGEGVDDHGGPYRAVFQQACGEEPEVLGLLARCKDGESRDLCELSPRSNLAMGAPSLPSSGSSSSSSNKEKTADVSRFRMFGKLLGMAMRHRIMVPTKFAATVCGSFSVVVVGKFTRFHSLGRFRLNCIRLCQIWLELMNTSTK